MIFVLVVTQLAPSRIKPTISVLLLWVFHSNQHIVSY